MDLYQSDVFIGLRTYLWELALQKHQYCETQNLEGSPFRVVQDRMQKTLH